MRDKGTKAIIACQAPIDTNVDRFWQMIWENECELIVMLCPLVSPAKVNKMLTHLFRKSALTTGLMMVMLQERLVKTLS